MSERGNRTVNLSGPDYLLFTETGRAQVPSWEGVRNGDLVTIVFGEQAHSAHVGEMGLGSKQDEIRLVAGI